MIISAKISEIAVVDRFGRIVIPKKMRGALGIGERTTVLLKLKDETLVITPAHKKNKHVAKHIASMTLPIGDWEQMEKEIEEAHGD